MLSHSGEKRSICLEVRSLKRFPTLFWRWVDYCTIPVILRNAAVLLSCNNPAVLHHPFVQNWRGKESCRWGWTGWMKPVTDMFTVEEDKRVSVWWVRGQDRGYHSLLHATPPPNPKVLSFSLSPESKLQFAYFSPRRDANISAGRCVPKWKLQHSLEMWSKLPASVSTLQRSALNMWWTDLDMGRVGPNRTLQEVMCFSFLVNHCFSFFFCNQTAKMSRMNQMHFTRLMPD